MMMSEETYTGISLREEYEMGTLVTPSTSGILPDSVDVYETFRRVGGGPQQSLPLRVGISEAEAQSTILVRESIGIETKRQGFESKL